MELLTMERLTNVAMASLLTFLLLVVVGLGVYSLFFVSESTRTADTQEYIQKVIVTDYVIIDPIFRAPRIWCQKKIYYYQQIDGENQLLYVAEQRWNQPWSGMDNVTAPPELEFAWPSN
jgi:hypothetical protein